MFVGHILALKLPFARYALNGNTIIRLMVYDPKAQVLRCGYREVKRSMRREMLGRTSREKSPRLDCLMSLM